MLLLSVELPNIKHGFCRTRVNRPSADASSLFFRQELSPESDVPSESMKKARGAEGERAESIHHPDDLDAPQLREPKIIKHLMDFSQNHPGDQEHAYISS